MPTTTGTFSTHLAPTQPSFDEIAIDGPIVDARPIPEVLTHVISTEPSGCSRISYAAPALSTPQPDRPGLPARPGFYFTGDFGHTTDDEGDYLRFSREWSTIPAAYTRAAGTFSYRFPGLQGGSVGSPLTITAMVPATADVSYVAAPVFTSAAHGLAVGARVHLILTFSGSGGVPTIATVTVTAVTTNTFTTTGLTLYAGGGSLGSFSSGTATLFVSYREPKTLSADSIEAFSYALPGVTAGITTAADFRPDPVFQPLDASTGEEIDIVAVGSIPSISEYRAQMAAGRYFVVESGIREYRGKILERYSRLVRYM